MPLGRGACWHVDLVLQSEAPLTVLRESLPSCWLLPTLFIQLLSPLLDYRQLESRDHVAFDVVSAANGITVDVGCVCVLGGSLGRGVFILTLFRIASTW